MPSEAWVNAVGGSVRQVERIWRGILFARLFLGSRNGGSVRGECGFQPPNGGVV